MAPEKRCQFAQKCTSRQACRRADRLEYGHDNPAVYALELLPLYDAIARVKVQSHWQTDVLAGFALGAVTG